MVFSWFRNNKKKITTAIAGPVLAVLLSAGMAFAKVDKEYYFTVDNPNSVQLVLKENSDCFAIQFNDGSYFGGEDGNPAIFRNKDIAMRMLDNLNGVNGAKLISSEKNTIDNQSNISGDDLKGSDLYLKIMNLRSPEEIRSFLFSIGIPDNNIDNFFQKNDNSFYKCKRILQVYGQSVVQQENSLDNFKNLFLRNS